MPSLVNKISCRKSMAFQIIGLKMDAPGILDHLQNISKEETSCTLVSIGGEKMEVEFIFLCIFLLISRSKHSYWPPSAPSWRPCSLRCCFNCSPALSTCRPPPRLVAPPASPCPAPPPSSTPSSPPWSMGSLLWRSSSSLPPSLGSALNWA